MRSSLIKVLKDNDIDYQQEDKLKLLKQIVNLLNSYEYEKDETPDNNNNPVLYFLTETKKGTDKHFASAATLLARVCDIPARYVSGYYLNNKEGNVYQIRSEDKYAWMEVYTSNYGWMPVEVVSEKEGESIDEYKFDRVQKEESTVEFFDVEERDNRNHIILIVGAVGVLGVISLIVISIIIKNNNRRKYLSSMGIEDNEHLKLIR